MHLSLRFVCARQLERCPASCREPCWKRDFPISALGVGDDLLCCSEVHLLPLRLCGGAHGQSMEESVQVGRTCLGEASVRILQMPQWVALFIGPPYRAQRPCQYHRPEGPLQRSAAYPPRMGKLVIRMWQTHCSPLSASASSRAPMGWKHPDVSPLLHRPPSLVTTSACAHAVAWHIPGCDEAPVASMEWKRPWLATSSTSDEGHGSCKFPRSTAASPNVKSSGSWKLPDL